MSFYVSVQLVVMQTYLDMELKYVALSPVFVSDFCDWLFLCLVSSPAAFTAPALSSFLHEKQQVTLK